MRLVVYPLKQALGRGPSPQVGRIIFSSRMWVPQTTSLSRTWVPADSPPSRRAPQEEAQGLRVRWRVGARGGTRASVLTLHGKSRCTRGERVSRGEAGFVLI